MMALPSYFLSVAHSARYVVDNLPGYEYPYDDKCNATFNADPDIAGPGVIAAFLATGWITCIVAVISASFDLRRRYWNSELKPKVPLEEATESEVLGPNPGIAAAIPPQPVTPENTPARPQHRVERAARKLLVNLSDLQVITGTSIIIAGLAQLPEISYYHEFLVNQYWYLCLNSFWAAKTSYLEDDESDENWWPAVVRRTAILFNVVLALAFNIKTNLREQYEWHIRESGKCYISNDGTGSTQNWVWVGGLFVYAIFLVLSLNKRTLKWLEPEGAFAKGVDSAVGWLVKTHGMAIDRIYIYFHSSSSDLVFYTIWGLDWAFQSFCRTLWWFLVQWCYVWAWGTGRYGVQVAVYIAFTIWSSYDIIDLKRSNWHLVNGTESVWAFGQVLPVALMAMLVVNAIDAFNPDKCRHCGKCSCRDPQKGSQKVCFIEAAR